MTSFLKDNIRCVIPVAGVGSRLHPITHSKPKPLICVAGRPIIFHIIDKTLAVGINKFVIIVGYYKELIIDVVTKAYPQCNITFIEQKEPKGLGDAVYCSRPYFQPNESMLLIYGDILFDVDLQYALKIPSSFIGVTKVSNPQQFGVVELSNDQKEIISLEEKPEQPKSNFIISGVNFFSNPLLLFKGIEYVIQNNIKVKGEYQITSAFSYLLEKRAETIRPLPLTYWYDVGTFDSLLAANKKLLETKGTHLYPSSVKIDDTSVISDQALIGENVIIENSHIKGGVSILSNSKIQSSVIENSIIATGCSVRDSNIHDSIIGDASTVEEINGICFLGANTSIKK